MSRRASCLASLLALAAPTLLFGSSEPSPALDACGLFDSEAVAETLGAKRVDSQSGRRDGGDLAISTCYFRVPDSTRSVSVELRSSGPRLEAREQWQTLFHGERPERELEAERERRSPGAEEETAPETQPAGVVLVEPLGDEAYFVGAAVYGALYVLRGEVYLRLSVGGTGDLAAKLDLARGLAALALRRLDAAAVDPDRRSALELSEALSQREVLP